MERIQKLKQLLQVLENSGAANEASHVKAQIKRLEGQAA